MQLSEVEPETFRLLVRILNRTELKTIINCCSFQLIFKMKLTLLRDHTEISLRSRSQIEIALRNRDNEATAHVENEGKRCLLRSAIHSRPQSRSVLTTSYTKGSEKLCAVVAKIWLFEFQGACSPEPNKNGGAA